MIFKFKIVKCGWPWVIWPLVVFFIIGLISSLLFNRFVIGLIFYLLGLIISAFMLYFYRDPERYSECSNEDILSGADGLIRSVEELREDNFLKTDTVRISVFLSPFDVHVNRSPIAGVVKRLEYTAGRHILTLRKESSTLNEHSSILIKGEKIDCLVKQIVGPVVRRVVYWLNPDQILQKGERIGMMRFGSRLDIYLPRAAVEVKVKKNDRVRAGVTIIAKIKG